MNVYAFRGFESRSLRQSLIEFCRARWGTSGALYLQPATAGSKAYHEASVCKDRPKQVVLTAESNAIGLCEPRQVWEEAAISRPSYVPLGSLARANYLGNTWEQLSKIRARHLIYIEYSCRGRL